VIDWESRALQIRKHLFQYRKLVDDYLSDIQKELKVGTLDIKEHVKEISVWNNIGKELFFFADYLLSAEVYRNMLQTILEEETRQSVRLHKGLALYNLGLSQIQLGDLDEGIPNILLAYIEDVRNFGQPVTSGLPAATVKNDILRTTSNQIAIYLKSIRRVVKTYPISKLSEDDLLSVLSEDEQLLLCKIIISYSKTPHRNDTYTKFTMLDNLKNIYLLTEVVLKKRAIFCRTLSEAVDTVFKKERWKNIYNTNKILKTYNQSSPNKLEHFDAKLIKLVSFIDSYRIKNLEDMYVSHLVLLTVLTRNYIFHVMESNCTLTKNHKLYNFLFDSGMQSLLYSLATIYP
jgi:hypothetical protein